MTPSFIAERAKANPASASTYSIPVSGIQAGNTIILFVALGVSASSPGISSVSDDGNNFYSIDESVLPSSTSCGIGIISGAVNTPPTTITLKTTLVGGGVTYKVEEFSGVFIGTGGADQGSTNSAGTSTSVTTNTLSPSKTGELVCAMWAVPVAQSSFTVGTINGQSASQAGTPNNTALDLCVEYVVSTSTGSQSGNGTLAAAPTNNWRGIAVSYKPLLPTEVQTIRNDSNFNSSQRASNW